MAEVDLIEAALGKYRKIRVWVVVAVLLLSALILALGVTVKKVEYLTLYTAHDPISIEDSTAFNSTNGVVRGDGSVTDPYVIEGLSIRFGGSAGIKIANTTAHVVIKNCSIYGDYHLSLDIMPSGGVELYNASNVGMQFVTVQNAYSGVYAVGTTGEPVTGIEFEMGTIAGCQYGLVLINATESTINRSLIWGSGSTLSIENCSSIDILGNSIEGYVPYPYDWYWSSRTSIKDSSHIRFTGNAGSREIETNHCNNVSISESSFWHSDYDASVLAYDCNWIEISNTSCQGLGIGNSANCTISDNRIEPFTAGSDYGGGQIDVWASTDVKILRNDLTEARGISAQSVEHCTVAENVISRCAGLALVASGSDITIVRNVIALGSMGLLVSGDNITIEANRIHGNNVDRYRNIEHVNSYHNLVGGYYFFRYIDHFGLLATRSDSLSISNNSVYGNSGPGLGNEGVVISECSNLTLLENGIMDNSTFEHVDNTTVSGNNLSGDSYMILDMPLGPGLRIVRNNMIDLTIDAPSMGTGTTWNDSYPAGGNFWSNYTGVDVMSGPNQDIPGSDGIGDAPLKITSSEADPYPLMNPVETDDRTSPLTVLTLSGEAGDRGWYTSAVNLSFESSDTFNGVAHVLFKIDDGNLQNYTSPVSLVSDGAHTVEYYSVDGSLNAENVRSTSVRIDSSRPHVSDLEHTRYHFSDTKTAVIDFPFYDAGGNVTYYYIHGSYYSGDYYQRYGAFSTLSSAEVELSDGTMTYLVTAYDEAGNQNSIDIEVIVSLNENRQPLSLTGPYGPWYLVAILVDLVLFGYFVRINSFLSYAPLFRPPPGRSREPGEVDKGEMEDGYPKYFKKM